MEENRSVQVRAPFDLYVNGTAANTTVTGMVTSAVVDAFLSIPIVAVQRLQITFRQAAADIDVQFHTIGTQTVVRKRWATANIFSYGIMLANSMDLDPQIRDEYINQLRQDFAVEIRRNLNL